MNHPSDHDFWLFGYGSLIWKPPPHYDQRVPGFIKGYVRRFWQASQDHRGTPEHPGRVVTLIERSFWETLDDRHWSAEEDHVWGVAYHIIPSKVAEVQEYLDIREINGYSIQYTPFHPADQQRPAINCMVYIGMPDNPQFLGALNPQAVALKINESSGPSGENQSKDEHITDLARRVRAMEPQHRPALQDVSEPLTVHKVNSTEEQEEVEKDCGVSEV